MTPTPRAQALFAATGSALLLAAAFGFQFAGYPPCHLCWLQRYPHMVAVVLGLLLLVVPSRWIMAAGAVAAGTSAVLGVFHTGVEKQWWEGPTTCSSTGVSGMSVQDLLAQIDAAPLIRCDQVAWQLFGLSMASWNALFAAILALLWLGAFRRAT